MKERKHKNRIHFYLSSSKTSAALGPWFFWQEWFGGFYCLQIEIWLVIWGAGLEFTNRPPDPDISE